MHKGDIFLCLASLLGSCLKQNISRTFVFVVLKVKGREMNFGAFVVPETERSNILILGATGPDEHTGGAVTYMHLHLHTRLQH